jgi:hypothetical protein
LHSGGHLRGLCPPAASRPIADAIEEAKMS